ncbi:hypothetical protein ACSS6W_008371 [Trichoderma asperelloides]
MAQKFSGRCKNTWLHRKLLPRTRLGAAAKSMYGRATEFCCSIIVGLVVDGIQVFFLGRCIVFDSSTRNYCHIRLSVWYLLGAIT